VAEMGSWVVDYSAMDLSLDHDKRVAVGRKLVEVGLVLENEFGGPQDVEGGLVGGEVYVVQTRPQP
jgi:phosphoglucan, water dikinase